MNVRAWLTLGFLGGGRLIPQPVGQIACRLARIIQARRTPVVRVFSREVPMEPHRVGDTLHIEFDATLEDGTALDLTGAQFIAALQPKRGGSAVKASACALTTAPKWRATWDAAATAGLLPIEYRFEGVVKLADGQVLTVGEGELRIVTRITTVT